MAAPRKSTKPAMTPKAAPAPMPAAPAIPTPPAPTAPVIVERSEVKGSGKPKMPASRTPTHDEIKRRAFEIYAGRGYAPGDPVADWLEAERQLKAGL